MGVRKGLNTTTYPDLALAIESVLPYTKSTTNKIVKTIFKAIRKGLERDGRVVIPGFGTFKVITRPAHKRYVSHFFSPRPNPGNLKKRIYLGRTLIDRPEKRAVVFTPSRIRNKVLKEGVVDES